MASLKSKIVRALKGRDGREEEKQKEENKQKQEEDSSNSTIRSIAQSLADRQVTKKEDSNKSMTRSNRISTEQKKEDSNKSMTRSIFDRQITKMEKPKDCPSLLEIYTEVNKRLGYEQKFGNFKNSSLFHENIQETKNIVSSLDLIQTEYLLRKFVPDDSYYGNIQNMISLGTCVQEWMWKLDADDYKQIDQSLQAQYDYSTIAAVLKEHYIELCRF